jgi:hypothetical protein
MVVINKRNSLENMSENKKKYGIANARMTPLGRVS